MRQKTLEQKLLIFSYNEKDLENISKEMRNGWSIVNLVRNGDYFVAIMELHKDLDDTSTLFIPPRKKIKIK